MANRFVPDHGLTARMTAAMFVLGGLFVLVVVGLMYLMPQWAILIGLVGLGIAWFQWYQSDTIAMRAMNWPDAFPHTDLGIRKALKEHRAKRVLEIAESWRPWRSYAVMHLWKSLEN